MKRRALAQRWPDAPSRAPTPLGLGPATESFGRAGLKMTRFDRQLAIRFPRSTRRPASGARPSNDEREESVPPCLITQ
jgi:hypothetical protein